MKSSLADVAERRERLASLLRQTGYLSVSDLCSRFSVSEATVRRDLAALEKEKKITRTYGGALSEYDAFFTPFYQRSEHQKEAKRRVARAAVNLLKEGQRVFLDAGSTVFAIAELLAELGMSSVRAVTNSLPVAEVLASADFPEVHLLGGQLLTHQLVVVGPGASIGLSAWRFDVAFLSAEGATQEGLWNSQDDISDFQRHLCGRSEVPAFCLDSSKLGLSAPSFLLPWDRVEYLVSDGEPGNWESQIQGAGLQWIKA